MNLIMTLMPKEILAQSLSIPWSHSYLKHALGNRKSIANVEYQISIASTFADHFLSVLAISLKNFEIRIIC